MAKAKLFFIVIAAIAIGFILLMLMSGVGIGLFSIAGQQIDFAGFTFTVDKVCGGFNVVKDGEFLLITASNGEGRLLTDVTDVDEVLIIYDGSVYATCSGSSGGNAASSISAGIIGSDGGSVGLGESISTTQCINSVGDTKSRIIEPGVWKLKNNFDGTWSALVSLGVGDIFVDRSGKVPISGTPMLNLFAGGSKPFGCFGGGSQTDTFSKETFRIFNIVRKENSFAVCKANEVLVGDVCSDLDTILLNHEEAFFESVSEKLTRIEAEQQAKVDGLTQQIADLTLLVEQGLADTSDTDRIIALEEELKITKGILADVQAGDKNVIVVVEADEKFDQPGFFKTIWNKIIAFFKNLF